MTHTETRPRDLDAVIVEPSRVPKVVIDPRTRQAATRVYSHHIGQTLITAAARVPIHLTRWFVIEHTTSLTRPWRAGRLWCGIGRLVDTLWRWTFDKKYDDVRYAVMHGEKLNASAYRELRQDHHRRVMARILTTTTSGLVTLGAVGTMAATAPPAWQAGAAAATAFGLIVAGRPRKELVATPLSGDLEETPQVTRDLVVRALTSAVPSISKAWKDLEAAPPFLLARDGEGWLATIDLPHGVTAADVIEKRAAVASGLRRPLSAVWPSTDDLGHAGRLNLYVADRPLSEGGSVDWLLADAGIVNVFKPFPIGVDPRGRTVNVDLSYASGVIGAIPRMGKSYLLRLLLLGAALDPRVEIHAYTLKGGVDLKPLAPIAHAYRSGDSPEDLDALRDDLLRLQADLTRRYKVFEALPDDRCPDGKVTDELASDPTLGLHPIVLAIDECQFAFEHPTRGKEFVAIVTDLVKRGPACGIWVWASTQRPDANALPRSISSNAVLRFCLLVMGQIENDMILGQSMFQRGVRATEFTREDKGWAIMTGEGREPVTVHIALVDRPKANDVVARALAARRHANLLSGLAAGVGTPDTDETSFIDHVLAVWPEDDPEWPKGRVWCDELADRLATRNPGRYGKWTGKQVADAARSYGIEVIRSVSHTVNGKRANRLGLDRADVAAVVAGE